MNKVDEQISALLRNNASEPPAEVMDAIDNKLNELPQRPLPSVRKTKKYLGLASVAMIFLTVALSLFHPSVSNAIQQLPLIGQVFQTIEDKGLKRVSELGLSSPIFMSYTYNGITITITEVMNDGNRLNIGYTEEHSDPIIFTEKTESDFYLTTSRLYINGEHPTGYAIGGKAEKQISDRELAGVIELQLLEEELTEIDSLQFSLFRLGTYSGEWDFTLENIPLISDSKTIVIDKHVVIDERFSIYIEKIKSSSATIGVYYEIFDHESSESQMEGKYYSVDKFYTLERERYDWLPGPYARLIPKGNDEGIVLSIFQREQFIDVSSGQRVLVDQLISDKPVMEIDIHFSDYE